MVVPVSSQDFADVADQIGETVTIYSPTQTFSSDYDSIATSSLGSGTQETVVVEPVEAGEIQRHHGKLEFGDIWMFFKSSSVIANDSLVKQDSTSKYYKVVFLEAKRVGDAVHHYEVLLRFVK